MFDNLVEEILLHDIDLRKMISVRFNHGNGLSRAKWKKRIFVAVPEDFCSCTRCCCCRGLL